MKTITNCISLVIAAALAALTVQTVSAKPAPSTTVVIGNTGYTCPIPKDKPYDLFNGDYVVHTNGEIEAVNPHEPIYKVQIRVMIPAGMSNNIGRAINSAGCWRWGDLVQIGEIGTIVEHTRSSGRDGFVKDYQNTIYYKTEDGENYIAFSNVLEISEIRAPSSLSARVDMARSKVSPDIAFRHDPKKTLARRRKIIAQRLGVKESEVPDEKLTWFRPGPARDSAEEWPWPPYELPKDYVKTPGRLALPNGRILTFPAPKNGKTIRVHSFGNTYEADADGNWRDVSGSKNPALRKFMKRTARAGEAPFQAAIDEAYSNLVKAIDAKADKLGIEPSHVTEEEIDPKLITALDEAEKALDDFRKLPPDGFTVAVPDEPGFMSVAQKERARKAMERRRRAKAARENGGSNNGSTVLETK